MEIQKNRVMMVWSAAVYLSHENVVPSSFNHAVQHHVAEAVPSADRHAPRERRQPALPLPHIEHFHATTHSGGATVIDDVQALRSTRVEQAVGLQPEPLLLGQPHHDQASHHRRGSGSTSRREGSRARVRGVPYIHSQQEARASSLGGVVQALQRGASSSCDSSVS